MSTPAAPAAPASATPAGPAAPAAAAPAQAEIRKMKLKLDGHEVELPESEVIAYAQQGKVASQRFQEASALKKQAEQIMQAAKSNPVEFFKQTGLDPRQWSEQYLLEQLQIEAMSPEQKKARENEDRLRKYEANEKAQKEAKQNEERLEMQKEHHDRYEKLFISALNESGLPRTKFTIKRMAELQLINIKNKYELNAGQLAKIVREDYISEQKALFGAAEGDQLLELFGPELIKKLSKAQIAQLKAKGLTNSTGSKPKRQDAGDEQPLDWDTWKKRNRGRA